MQVSWSLPLSPPSALCCYDEDVHLEGRSELASRCGIGFMTEPIFLSDLPTLPAESIS